MAVYTAMGADVAIWGDAAVPFGSWELLSYWEVLLGTVILMGKVS